MVNNPNLYEINTRVWLRRYDTQENRAGLADVPENFFDWLEEKGIDCLWLMGIWKNCPTTINEYCFEEGLIYNYRRALKNWSEDDIIGSPYSIDNYEINPDIGSFEDVELFRKKLNSRGIKLVLDFISNHFSVHSSLLRDNPDLFLEAGAENYYNDPYTYFPSSFDETKYFAHGRDPFFPAWQDTVQVNYFNPYSVNFMIGILEKLSRLCDGVRCDMAMLTLSNVFQNTWGGVLGRLGYYKPDEEFWKKSIERVKSIKPDFIFLAETYWDLEWDLQQIGFDYTYDKRLTDRLKSGSVSSIREHLQAKEEFQRRSVRFIENHDEDRAVTALGREKAFPAAVIMSTLQGMHFYHDGQFDGKKIRLPVQLGREPIGTLDENIHNFYDKLLYIIKDDVFKAGEWFLLEPFSVWEGDETYKNILAWEWKLGTERRLVVVNYENCLSKCRLRIDMQGYGVSLKLIDLLQEKDYIRNTDEIFMNGLYIELKNYQSHIFSFSSEIE